MYANPPLIKFTYVDCFNLVTRPTEVLQGSSVLLRFTYHERTNSYYFTLRVRLW